jgi:hypothetical protein
MMRAILRSFLVAAVVGALVGAGYLLAFAACTDRAAPGREVLQVDGFVRARDQDRVWVCGTRHCFGDVLFCHEDDSCWCAPAAWDVGQVSGRLRASSCRPDDGAACKNARCRAHVEE